MSDRVKDRLEMIRGMTPRLVEGRFVFVTLKAVQSLPDNFRATMLEDEGVSVIVPAGATDEHVMRQITLDVHSALDGVGLTAAVSAALADHGIPANVVAGHHHDHIFVPEEQADLAVDVLRTASKQAE